MKTNEKRYFINGMQSCRFNVERIFGEDFLLSLNFGLQENGFTEKAAADGSVVRCELREEVVPSYDFYEVMNSARY